MLKYIRIIDKGFIQAITKFNLLRQKYHGKFLNLYWKNSKWKLNPKSKNNQTDASCTKYVVGLCSIFFFIILTQLELFVAFSKVNNQLVKF